MNPLQKERDTNTVTLHPPTKETTTKKQQRVLASGVPAVLNVTLPTCASQSVSFLLGLRVYAVRSDISN